MDLLCINQLHLQRPQKPFGFSAKQSCHKFDARPGFKTRIELACPCHHMSSSGHRMTLLSLLLRNLPILSHSHWPYHWNRAAPPIAPGSVGLLGNESDWGKQNRSKVGLVGKQIDLEEFGKSLDYAEFGPASNVGSAFGCWSETAPLQVFSRNLSKHQRQYSTHHHHFEMLRVFPFPACSLVATMVKGGPVWRRSLTTPNAVIRRAILD
jgi:hypothetical protein